MTHATQIKIDYVLYNLTIV